MSIHDLPPAWREAYEERAAICQYDAGLTRADAERFAWREIEQLMRAAQQGNATT